ncbi:translation initiation factor IF-2 [Clostridium pasteurianum DSM 525 = ATCC 6013]|uniref:Translation initiation factor IF-2 n=1 Tax=Clostridium pasteurianum DSM 525 = ATCC 6013 TaxID=1262449 RepID=A0A0H3J4Z5_CLOPA|nr:translation initiation factor IF-2 [Clostridium pasteurianum]AJA48107.1 translation initiation factor IF-2 [Clostridium pasteurianum DSM 525 = ATCC 6013]AJA52095.1 translation initiation factor IF-2 [Clostridium pasteurianum DSM 525 = ATCC 6013]AOZ75374.1 translation initiation factor IF-2 [Clostridium pasteurianum DSM 525 = ATCC 6013]AOZ79169.1 translation initiation factor IF-2 [Clostridium pasteurianum]ELP60740.1 translation initiation factor IF-2 [Clostridium pasteurianum DSM 525 = ATCC
MSKIRVHELAKELDISSKDLINLLLEEFSIEVKNHMSTIDDEDAELIKEFFADNEKQDIAESAVAKKEDIVEEYEEILNDSIKEIKHKKNKNKKMEQQSNKDSKEEASEEEIIIEIDKTITVKELSEKLSKPTAEVIKQLMFMGVMAAINQEIDFETAEKLCEKFNAIAMPKEEDNESEFTEIDSEADDDELLEKRPPVVTVMGHVDHGKTSLLDAIRKAKVTETEAGGITQHIGAYVVNINNERIAFLDTPGHEAFTAMRARGAQITDIVILVVAADDGIMPQTKEAINHCKAANVPIIVAINKIDKPGANPDKVKQELTEHGLVPEDWGGDTICVPVSARTKEGIDNLLEMIILTAEVQELKANPNRKAKGAVIESKLDKGRGPVASLLVQNGTLHVGDSILVGSTYGRIRAMFDDNGRKIKKAGPSIPVEILGLSDVPSAGDKFNVIRDEKTARNMSEKRKEKLRTASLNSNHKVSLEDLYNQIQEGKVKELNIIIKADVQGSIEALKQSLEKLSTDSVKVRVIHGAVGAITETDVTLASASNAIIIGFNVRPDTNATTAAEKEDVDIKTYRIIYNALDDIKSAMIGMLEPEFKEVILGKVEIRQVYKISSIGTVAGCYVLDGKITRNSSIRIIRDGIVILEGELGSLKRFKDDVKEVAAGYECGLTIEKFNDIKEGDILEVFAMEEIKAKEL